MEYTRQELIAKLQQKAAALGKTPTMNDMLFDPEMPNDSAYIKEFGTWTKAAEAAGLKPTLPGSKQLYTDQELITAMQDAAKKLHHTPSSYEMNALEDSPSSRSFIRKFGSWECAVRAAGLTPPPKRRRGGRSAFSNEKMIQSLRDLAEKLGKTPSRIDIDSDPDTPQSHTYVSHFGTWNRALELAGLTPNRSGRAKR